VKDGSSSDDYDAFWGDSESNTKSSLMVNTSHYAESPAHNEQALIHQNVTRLANKLFANANNIKLSQAVAVGTFLPIHLNTKPNLAEQHYIGLQIQESFITLAAQAGLNVIEFKAASAIKITSDADVMLSRDTKDLQRNINAQYFITGTYSEHENKLVVNARIIELPEQKIIAAATGYIPMPSLNDKQKITMKNDMLYRKAL